MPLSGKIRQRRGAILAISIALVVLLVAAIFTPEEEFDEWNISPYSAKSNGAKATFLLIGESGREVERWEKPPSELPDDAEGTLLLLVQPHRQPTPDDKKAIESFIARGGAVLAAGYYVGGMLPVDHSRFEMPLAKAWRGYERLLPSGVNRRATKVTMPERQSWPKQVGQVPAFGDDRGAVVVSYRHGEGTVIWMASPVPLTNAGLTAEGNVEFLSDVLDSTGARRVLWDTYFGEQREVRGWDLWSPPVMAGAAQLLLVFALIVWTYSRRAGPVHPAPIETRLSPLEFVNTLGGLYRSAGAANVAVDVSYRRFHFLASRRLGLRSDVSPSQLAEAVARFLRRRPEDVRPVLMECESARHDVAFPARRALVLSQTLNRYLRDMHLIEAPKEEKR